MTDKEQQKYDAISNILQSLVHFEKMRIRQERENEKEDTALNTQ